MEASDKKDKTRAFAGTVIFHLAVLACILLFGLSSPMPLPEERGILVTLGYSDEGIGERQPLAEPVPEPRPVTPVPEADPEAVVTQETEESVALPEEIGEQTVEQEQPEAEIPDHIADAEQSVDEEPDQEPEQEVDQRALFPGRDQRTTDRQDQGEEERSGDAGRPEGTADSDDLEGLGAGDGIEYSLSGRQANYLPLPDYTTQATGRVVVQITVNRRGQVIRASAGARGTTTTNQTLHRLAEEAARRARFDLKADAPEEQTGTITYNFIRLN